MKGCNVTVMRALEAETDQRELASHECQDGPIEGFCWGIIETRKKLIARALVDGRSYFGAEDVAHECFKYALEVRERRAGTDQAVRCLCGLAMRHVLRVLPRLGRRRTLDRKVKAKFLQELELEVMCAVPDEAFLLSMLWKAVNESTRQYTKLAVEEVMYGGTEIPKQRKSQELKTLRQDVEKLLLDYGSTERLFWPVRPGRPKDKE
jgi:hypothetical protein